VLGSTKLFATCGVHHGYRKGNYCCWEVGGVDGPLACEDVATNNSNMENVRPILGYSLENEVLQLVAI
jgi:hypothetical protein